MKRLQFRHQNSVFESREAALKFFASIVDTSTTASTAFGTSLYAEPMVAKYTDGEGNTQILLAIGVEDGHEPYHIIDSAKIAEDLVTAFDVISANTEAINNEIADRIAADEDLQEQITDNIAKITPVAPSSENVLEEFALINAKNEILGKHIKIYKDNALVSSVIGYKGVKSVVEKEDGTFEFSYGDDMDKDTEYLYLIYRNEKGVLSFVGIDFENFLLEAEFGNGLKVVDHIASIKVADGEKFIIVDEAGIKTVGIDTAFDALNEKIDVETARAEAADVDLQKQVNQNKVFSKDVVLEEVEEGTKLTLQVDGKTISKDLVYENGIAVLSTLLKIVEVPVSSAAYKAEYELQDAEGTIQGERIKIAKESSLSNVEIGKLGDNIDTINGNYISRGTGNDTLNFIYLKNNGSYELVQVEISKYFTDAHFGRGLNNQDGIVSLLEGDGNEYLVIGEDTIAVIGVKEDIAKAKAEAVEAATALVADEAEIREADDKAIEGRVMSAITEEVKDRENADKVLAEQISASTAYTDTRITDLTSTIGNLTDTLNESTNRVNDAILQETENREAAVKALHDELTAHTETANATFATKESVNTLVEKTSGLTIEAAKSYADKVGEDTIAKVNGEKFVDVILTDDKWIKLVKMDGTTVSTGFNAAEFIKDSVLKNVALTDNKLIFEWNDEDHTRMEIPLVDFIDEYVVAEDSFNYLRIAEHEIHAIVDDETDHANSLVSLNKAKEMNRKALDDAAAYTNSKFAEATSAINDYIKSLEERIAELENGMESMENTIKNIISSYLKFNAVDNETKVETVTDNDNMTVTVGFADNAIFGEDED